jgi:hypothetical protein
MVAPTLLSPLPSLAHRPRQATSKVERLSPSQVLETKSGSPPMVVTVPPLDLTDQATSSIKERQSQLLIHQKW